MAEPLNRGVTPRFFFLNVLGTMDEITRVYLGADKYYKLDGHGIFYLRTRILEL